MGDVLKNLLGWIDHLGLPVALNILLLIALVALYLWSQHRFKHAELKESANLKFLETRLKDRYDFMKEFYHWVAEFDHCVEHIAGGNLSYESRLVEFRQKLREGARNAILHGGSDFPKLVKEFTEIGSSVREGWDWHPYEEKKRELDERLEEIAKTLPA